MASYISNRDGGETNQEGHYRFHVRAWSGNIQNGLQAVQKSPLALGVDIGAGDLKIDYDEYGFTGWTDAVTSVTLTTADPSNPRIDRIVAYVDLGETPSPATPNNPGLLKFAAVAGTPGSVPARPSDGAVDTALSNNPWADIADVRVNAGVTQVSNANITDTRIFISAQLTTGAQSALVATSQTYASATFGDLATVGPTVTVNIGANGLALVSLYASISNSDASNSTGMSFAMSGANTQAAQTGFYLAQIASAVADSMRSSAVFLLTGLNPGATTFTAKYRASGGTGSFADRRIAVVPL